VQHEELFSDLIAVEDPIGKGLVEFVESAENQPPPAKKPRTNNAGAKNLEVFKKHAVLFFFVIFFQKNFFIGARRTCF